MKNFIGSGKKLQHLCSCSCFKMACFFKSTWFLIICFYRYILLRMNSFWIQVVYFVSISCIGYWILKVLKPRTHDSFNPRSLDLFFTSVSAATVSSMSTVEMEVFSNAQLIVLTILMFIGGEVFTSMVGLHLDRFKLKKSFKNLTPTSSFFNSSSMNVGHHIELGHVEPVADVSDFEKSESPAAEEEEEDFQSTNENLSRKGSEYLIYDDSIKFLGFVVLGYLLAAHILGVSFISIYLNLSASAKNVLNKKGLKEFTFSLFTSVSTFSSCGFVPTNENMIVFNKNSGLLLILIPQVLLGNTLFPSCLRFCIWLIGRFFKKEEANYLLNKSREIGYLHLLPALHSSLLVVTVLGFIFVQLIMFCSMEWNSAALGGLNSYQKIVGGLFQVVNSRHSGETIVDISTIAPAILVLFVIMMYLPPYTSFLPVLKGGDDQRQPQAQAHEAAIVWEGKKKGRRGVLLENVIFSQLSYLSIFIILICISERKKMKEDPLNFSVLNIVIEVISAYGNVGFTTGYSCDRQLKADGRCESKWYGFSGKWSDQGKLILIVVMLFGRLKKFNMDGGKAWKLI